jgi:hypothetical protein
MRLWLIGGVRWVRFVLLLFEVDSGEGFFLCLFLGGCYED